MQATLYHNGAKVQIPSDDWLTKIAALGVECVVFDCDGTLADSTAAHFLCLQAAVRAQGFDMAQRWYETRSGLDRASIFERFKAEVAETLDIDSAIDHSVAQFGGHVDNVKAIKATVALLHQLAEHGYPLAVVTNSERSIATQSLRQIGVFDALQALVCITDGLPAKPAPQMFERAAKLFGLLSEQVVVFEDSPEGVKAAIAAKMPVFEVTIG